MANILTNKYFVVALVIFVILLLYLYFTKKSCNVESMANLQLPSGDDESHDMHDSAKICAKNKTSKNIKQSKLVNQSKNVKQSKLTNPIKSPTLNFTNPEPYDTRPELAACQPCICPKNKFDTDTSDTSDADIVIPKKYIRQLMKHNKTQ